MSIASLMNTTVSIETETTAKNAAGLISRTWATLSSGLPARVEDLDSKTVLEYARLGYESNASVYFASDPGLTGLEAKSRIVVASYAYYVDVIQNQGGRLNKLWKVVCTRKPLTYSTNG